MEQEKNKENLVQITEETLSIFAISREQRKYAFKYLYETIKPYNMSQKLYFKTVLIFDSFLINYSRNNTHLTCSQFFLSKHDKKISETKLIMFILCCFYLVNQTLNTQNFELKCLQKWDEKDEYTYDELNQLIYTILRGIDCNIDLFGLSFDLKLITLPLIYILIGIISFEIIKKLIIKATDRRKNLKATQKQRVKTLSTVILNIIKYTIVILVILAIASLFGLSPKLKKNLLTLSCIFLINWL